MLHCSYDHEAEVDVDRCSRARPDRWGGEGEGQPRAGGNGAFGVRCHPDAADTCRGREGAAIRGESAEFGNRGGHAGGAAGQVTVVRDGRGPHGRPECGGLSRRPSSDATSIIAKPCYRLASVQVYSQLEHRIERCA